MKKVVFFLTLLILVGTGPVMAAGNMDGVYQDPDEELIPTEDSVSIDDMDPIFYDAEEDEVEVEEESGNSTKLLIGIAGAVILIGLGLLFVRRSGPKKEE